MISFRTNVSVPKDVIEQIGEQIKNLVVVDMHTEARQWNVWTPQEVERVKQLIGKAVVNYAFTEQKICDGWTLEREEAEIIAAHLRDYKLIYAIKAFRTATGAGLAESKYFLDKFGKGPFSAEEFLTAFI